MDEQRIKALEDKVEKLDRLVYRLFRDMKALITEVNGVPEPGQTA